MSEVAVPDWPRPRYKPSDSKASLFYLVFGDVPEHLNVKRARHHVDDLPPQLQVSIHSRSGDPAWFDAWLSKPLGVDIARVFGDEADAVFRAQRVAAVRADFDDPPTLAYLRNTVGVVSAISEAGAVAIFDVHALTWWRPKEWHWRFVEQSAFQLADHMFTAVSQEPGDAQALRLHTRGMGKLGRPELLVRHVPGDLHEQGEAVRHAGEVMDGVANYLARGGVIADGETMHFERYDASIVFFESNDEQKPAHHPTSPVLEICDINPDTGLSGDGISHLLARMSERKSP